MLLEENQTEGKNWFSSYEIGESPTEFLNSHSLGCFGIAALAGHRSTHRASLRVGLAVFGVLDCVLEACEKTEEKNIYGDIDFFSKRSQLRTKANPTPRALQPSR